MEHVHKVMLLGDIGVGKTSLVRRLIYQKFDHDYKATIGVDVYTHSLTLCEQNEEAVTVKQLIWDIDGDFGESIFKQIYIKGATAALIIGDCSRRTTLSSLVTLAQTFSEQFPGRPIALILNKTDLVEPDVLEALSASISAIHAPVVETSAKTGANVRQSFETVARAAHERGL